MSSSSISPQGIFQRKEKFIYTALFVFMLLAWFTLSIRLSDGPILHPEASGRIVSLSEEKPFFKKVFDIVSTEGGVFRAREMASVVDIIDAEIIEFFIKIKKPHFYSASFFVLTALMAALHYTRCIKYLSMSRPTSLLITSLLLSAPPFFISNYFFRSAKIGACFFFFLLVWRVFIELTLPKESEESPAELSLWGTTSVWLRVFLFSSIAGLFDHQGRFLVLILFIVLCLVSISRRLEGRGIILTALGAGIIFVEVYSKILGVELIRAISEVEPHVAVDFLLGSQFPIYFSSMRNLWEVAVGMTMDSFRMFIGAPAQFTAGVVLAGALGLLSKYRMPGEEVYKIDSRLARSFFNLVPLWIGLVTILSMIFLNTILITSMLHLSWEDLRYVYYSLPKAMLFYLFITGTLFVFIRMSLIKSYLLNIILAVLLTLNICQMPYYLDLWENGHQVTRVEITPKYLESITLLDKKVIPMDYEFHIKPDADLFNKLSERFYNIKRELSPPQQLEVFN